MSAGPSGRLAQLAVPFGLVGALAWAAPLDAAGAAAGLALAVLVHGLLVRAMDRRGLATPGPADRVTLVRAWLTCCVAGLTVDAYGGGRTAWLPVLAATALALDAVDGRVARRTGTVSVLGARFDLEVDALLVLVLSVDVARVIGWWVLTLGLARYAVLAAAVVAPWLRAGVAPSRWRKGVAATQGVALTAAAGGVPGTWSTPVLVVAGALLGLSFLTEVVELWRRRVREGHRSADGGTAGLQPAASASQAEGPLAVGAP